MSGDGEAMGRIDEVVALNVARQRLRSTTLYRLFDGDGRLLYVGVSGNPGRRFQAHALDKAWWGEVSTIAVEHHQTREAALKSEAEAIYRYQPLYNDIGVIDERFANLPCGLCVDGAPEHGCPS